MVEPNGRELLLGAAMVAGFTGNKISAFRNYCDDATLMEQMLGDLAVARAQPEGSNRLVVEDSPDPADSVVLEGHVAAAAAAAGGVGAEHEFGIFLRDDDGRVLAGISGSVWVGTASCQAMGVDESLRDRGWRERSSPAQNTKPGGAAACSSCSTPTTSCRLDSTSGSATRPSASSRVIQPAA